jgi:hypothetical protein
MWLSHFKLLSIFGRRLFLLSPRFVTTSSFPAPNFEVVAKGVHDFEILSHYGRNNAPVPCDPICPTARYLRLHGPRRYSV